MKKGDTVFYTNSASTFRARVKTMHRDGTVTVVALCQVRDGKDVPYSHMDFTYRTYASLLSSQTVASRTAEEKAAYWNVIHARQHGCA